MARPPRLGLFIDGIFHQGRPIHTNSEEFGFMRFASAVGAHFSRFAVIARATEDPTATPYALPPQVELISLPYYGSLRRIGEVLLALPKTIRRMWRGLDELDVVWVSGVHPVGLAIAAMARLRGRRAVLLIRQDSPGYFRSRLPGRAWLPVLAPLLFLDWCFRTLARRLPTTVVGSEIARRYRAPRPNVLLMHVTLLERSQLAAGPSTAAWSAEIGLLTVGRIAPEKNPVLIAEVLAELERCEPGRFRLAWVGEGPGSEALRERAVQLGIAQRLDLPGYVAFGPELLQRYRDAHAFIHVGLTEGVPGVLYEAMGCGLPIVATEVGGVQEALAGGEAGLLVPPRDPIAMAGSIRRLLAEPQLRARLSRRGLELARSATLESESARVAAFLGGDDRA
jgi:glycosyltransferase involved in cell wall biosynthesis